MAVRSVTEYLASTPSGLSVSTGGTSSSFRRPQHSSAPACLDSGPSAALCHFPPGHVRYGPVNAEINTGTETLVGAGSLNTLTPAAKRLHGSVAGGTRSEVVFMVTQYTDAHACSPALTHTRSCTRARTYTYGTNSRSLAYTQTTKDSGLHTHTHTHTHARTHARTHTHTHTTRSEVGAVSD